MRKIALACLASVALAQGQGPAVVDVASVEMREVASARTFVGSIAPARRTTVGAEIDGRVETYLATEGKRVEAEAPLATLRTRMVEIRLRAARAELMSRRQELNELKNGSREEDKEQARARVAQAQAELDLRAWKRDTAQRLHEKGSLSEDELKETILAMSVAKARLAEEQAKQALVAAGPRVERIAQAQARHDAQAAEVARLSEQKEQHTIRAPFAGYVVREQSQVGAWLKQGDAVAELVELEHVVVVLPVLEDFISGLHTGMVVSITVDALPAKRFDGKVTAIVPQADSRARTFPVKIRLKNPRKGGAVLLKVGMFVRAQLAVGEKVKALLVPKDAVVLGGPRPRVWVVDGDTVRPVPVQLGIAVDALIQVIADLKEGQKVVVRGNERLFRPGQRVRIRR